ncbi:MAG TPA: glycosyltransferase family 2 protein [Syntrophales bacterium]|nr:glycosyltransferase family 2 protein [Syntrophales bacterium]
MSLVILTWNSQSYIKQCIDSYAKALDQEGLTGEFLIVDNGSQDGTLEVIQKEIIPGLSRKHSVHIIPLQKNYGTTVSRNMALRKATGDYIIICDSDTEYYQGMLNPALHYLSSKPDVGVLAPLLLWPDGETQPSVRRFPTLFAKATKVLDIIFRWPIRDLDFYPDFPWNEIRQGQTAASACWIFRKNLLEIVGYLDEKIFYAPEDLDYCMRVWKKGLKLMFYPDIKIYHHAQRLSRRNPLSKHALSHFGGLLYYFRKHGYLFRRIS